MSTEPDLPAGSPAETPSTGEAAPAPQARPLAQGSLSPLLDSTFTVPQPPGRPFSWQPRLMFDGRIMWVVFASMGGGHRGSIWLARMHPDGSTAGPPMWLSAPAEGDPQAVDDGEPAIAQNGDAVVVAWIRADHQGQQHVCIHALGLTSGRRPVSRGQATLPVAPRNGLHLAPDRRTPGFWLASGKVMPHSQEVVPEIQRLDHLGCPQGPPLPFGTLVVPHTALVALAATADGRLLFAHAVKDREQSAIEVGAVSSAPTRERGRRRPLRSSAPIVPAVATAGDRGYAAWTRADGSGGIELAATTGLGATVVPGARGPVAIAAHPAEGGLVAWSEPDRLLVAAFHEGEGRLRLGPSASFPAAAPRHVTLQHVAGQTWGVAWEEHEVDGCQLRLRFLVPG